jgi:hypothetical protein
VLRSNHQSAVTDQQSDIETHSHVWQSSGRNATVLWQTG